MDKDSAAPLIFVVHLDRKTPRSEPESGGGGDGDRDRSEFME
jgi:hypothetical protein